MSKKSKKISSIELGKQIKTLRIGKRLSQKDLAERIGTHASHIGKIERGVNAPSNETRIKLEKELGPLTLPNPEIKETPIQYSAGGEMEEELIRKARYVLNSGTFQAAALHANILAFYESVKPKDDPGRNLKTNPEPEHTSNISKTKFN